VRTTYIVNEQPYFILGSERGEHLRVDVIRRSHSGATGFWDGNWVDAHIVVRAGVFRAAINAHLRTTDFAGFREQLETLYERLTGDAVFETMEKWLSIQVTGDGRPLVDVRAEVTDVPGTGNRLCFTISGIDRTDLFDVIAHLRDLESAFPTIGSADA
jgi:hypothetical protein